MSAPSTASSSPDGRDGHPGGSAKTSSSTSGGSYKFKFTEGQKVFCFHGKLMYEARCQKAEIRDGSPYYFVHYHGWNKNWDEWAEERRVYEFNPENQLRCEELRLENAAKSSSSKRVSSKSAATISTSNVSRDSAKDASHKSTGNVSIVASTAGSGDDKSSSKKRPRRTTRVINDDHSPKHNKVDENYRIPMIPDLLKKTLINDHCNVCQRRKIVKLPSKKTVNDILKEYVEDRISKENESNSVIKDSLPDGFEFSDEVTNIKSKLKNYGPNFRKSIFKELSESLKFHFNAALALRLLYNIEKLQYYELLNIDPLHTDDSDTHSTSQNKSRNRKSSDSNTHASKSSKTKSSNTLMNASLPSKIPPSDVCGPVHLLRLFTKLDLFQIQYDSTGKSGFLDVFFKDFLKFMIENHKKYFENVEYIDVNGDYLQKSLNLAHSLISNKKIAENQSMSEGDRSIGEKTNK